MIFTTVVDLWGCFGAFSIFTGSTLFCMNQRFNESKIENIPVFFSNLRQVKYLQAYLRDIRSL